VVIAYLPKATVQAAIGGAPLVAMQAAGMATGPGQVILAVAVLSILLTAPLGAWAIAYAGNRILEKESPGASDGDGELPIRVEAAMDMDAIAAHEMDTLATVFRKFSESAFDICPVVDSSGALSGAIRFEDLRPLLTRQGWWESLLALDACRIARWVPGPEDSLADAVATMKRKGFRQIPVVREPSREVVGILDAERAARHLEERKIRSRMENLQDPG
jgi:CBS domain-containing protein